MRLIQPAKTIALGVAAVLAVLVTGTGAAWASGVAMKTGLATPVMLADKKQTAYLKVGLTGVALEPGMRRAPVNVAVVLDKSGSMTGQKIAEAKRAAILAIDQLAPDDIVSVITYDSTVNVLVPATKLSDRSSLYAAINRIEAGGNTALFAGVSKGADEIRKFAGNDKVNRIILLSDGLANVGPSSPSDLAQLGSSLTREGITVSTIGLGLGYNEDLMTQLSSRGGGSHYFAEKATDLAAMFEREFRRTLSIVAQEVVVRIICVPGVRPVRVLGREAEIAGQQVTAMLDQVYSESEKYVILEVELPAREDGSELHVASVDASYTNMKTKAPDKSSARVLARFTKSAADVDANTDRDAMVAAVEQIATEKSQAAMKLRDEGKVEEARTVLMQNSGYLASNASKFRSDKLSRFQEDNDENAKNLDEASWARQRKTWSTGDVWRVKQ
jgi:Ca-activated chloride channel family protein